MPRVLRWLLPCVLVLLLPLIAWAQVTYDIVYVRAPRHGDETPGRMADVSAPVC